MLRALLACLLWTVPASAQTCADKLPRDVQTKLQTDFPGWKVVSLEMFSKEDQALLRKSKHSCPGIAVGRFTTDTTQYGISLMQNVKGIGFEQIIILSTGKAAPIIVSAPGRSDVWTVIYTVPPGIYTDQYEEKKIRTARQGIADEELEAAIGVFYWDGKQFRSIAVSI